MEKSKYKLGDLTEEYNEINADGELNDISYLQGINNAKYFQESNSNKNDIDLLRYKICRNNTFAYNKATSRNGEKISIAYRTDGDCLVSPSYICFRVVRKDLILDDYLMLWFRRPVFDRYVRFNSWGSATEFFTYSDFAETEIELPSIEEQEKIVRQYKAIEDRAITLLKTRDKILETALLYVKSKIKSYNKFSNMAELFDSKRKPLDSTIRDSMKDKKFPYYGAASLMDYVEDYLFSGIYGLIAEDGSVHDLKGHPTLQYVWGEFWVNNHAHIFKGQNGFSTELVWLLLKEYDVRHAVTGAVQLKLNQENLNNLEIPCPDIADLEEVNNSIKPFFKYVRACTDELSCLNEIKNTLLSAF